MWQLVDGGSTEHQGVMQFIPQTEGIGVYDGQLMVNPGVINVVIIARDFVDEPICLMRFWRARYEGDTGLAKHAHPYRLKRAIEYLLDDGVENIEKSVITMQDLLLCLEKGLEFDTDIQEL